MSGGVVAVPAPDAALTLAVPPGWIELKAFDDDAEALRWFTGLLDSTPALFDEPTRRHLLECYRVARAEALGLPVDCAGVLMTVYDGAPTLWTYTVVVIALPSSGEVNSMAVLQRYLESDGRSHLGPEDLLESVDTPAGQEVVAIHTTSPVAPALVEQVGDRVPGLGGAGSALGVVHSAVRLPRSPGEDVDRLVLVTGVAPRLEERLAMSLVAAQLTLTARAGSSADLPDERVIPPRKTAPRDSEPRNTAKES